MTLNILQTDHTYSNSKFTMKVSLQNFFLSVRLTTWYFNNCYPKNQFMQ